VFPPPSPPQPRKHVPLTAERPAAAPGQGGGALAPQGLQLELALHLLERAGHVWTAEAAWGSAEWLQSLIDGLCRLSSRDPLTGLANRRQFESALDQEVDRVARSGEPAMLLLFDIDHFKRINDTHGHAVGDTVLQAVGAALQDSVRPMDTVARIGGEEFAAVLPNCPPAFGRAVAERVRHNIERLIIPVGPGLAANVTISIGGAFAPPWIRSSGRLWVERADLQLYQAKAQGRNRVEIDTPPLSHVSPQERDLLFSAVALAPSIPAPDPSAP
jgi:diguanylate cyclase (GGDEF)-like protein